MKTPAGRAKKIATLVAMLARGGDDLPERPAPTLIATRQAGQKPILPGMSRMRRSGGILIDMVGRGIGVGAATVPRARATTAPRLARASLVLAITRARAAALPRRSALRAPPDGGRQRRDGRRRRGGCRRRSGRAVAGGSGAGGTAGGRSLYLRHIVASLATTDMVIDATTGADLFALTRAIGFAEGYAQCTCLAPQLPDSALDSCARRSRDSPRCSIR